MPTVTIGDGAAIGVAPTPPTAGEGGGCLCDGAAIGVAPTPPTAGEGGG